MIVASDVEGMGQTLGNFPAASSLGLSVNLRTLLRAAS
jgi:hypothetical protein